jgi:hypothetical protein
MSSAFTCAPGQSSVRIATLGAPVGNGTGNTGIDANMTEAKKEVTRMLA